MSLAWQDDVITYKFGDKGFRNVTCIAAFHAVVRTELRLYLGIMEQSILSEYKHTQFETELSPSTLFQDCQAHRA